MPQNKVWIPQGHFHSTRLNAVSRKIVDLAFTMGGSPGKYFHAVKCNYVFPDGTPCFDRHRSDHNIDCPLCKGKGVYYDTPKEIPIIVSDSTNPMTSDKYGVTFDDRVSLSIPIYVNPRIIKVSKRGQMHVVKDKFAVYDHQSMQWAIFVMDSEPFEPYLAGELYRVIEVTSQYTQNQDGKYDEPKIYYNFKEKELLEEINKDILSINNEVTSEYPNVDNDNVITTDEPNVTVIDDSSSLLDDWS